jgi:hypothetical protein
MTKKIRLSVAAFVAGTSLMAGGDIAPVEQNLTVPAVQGWEFNGQAVTYYQTSDVLDRDLFGSDSSAFTSGISLKAVNKDIAYGFGAGVTLIGLYSNKDWTDFRMQDADGDRHNAGGAVTEAFITYNYANTGIKAGRQELPKVLSPFAFSEKWNVFPNTFEAVLVTNSDVKDTLIVGAWVHSANSFGDMGRFDEINEDDGVFMLTAQNKTFENTTITGSYYFGNDMLVQDSLNVVWADVEHKGANYVGAVQAGAMFGADEDTYAVGAKYNRGFDISGYGVNAGAAISYVNDGTLGVQNIGGVKTPLYTQMILNQDFIAVDNVTGTVGANVDALYGNVGVRYGYTDSDTILVDSYQEVDVVYTASVKDVDLFAGYIYSNVDGNIDRDEDAHTLRFWARYNF